ncbi:MAG: SoxR reducing system RseC family protein [Prevotella sp.]|nr:SoxR reducing system RseC family protein [Prevotella sp.]
MSNKISHSGIVDSIGNDCLHVRILQASACGSCKAAAHCNAAERKEKIVDVYGIADAKAYRVGQPVNVVASTGTGMRAVVLAFVIPFVILIAVLFAGSLLTDDEGLLALVSIACLVPYYLILYMWRDKLQQKFIFYVE